MKPAILAAVAFIKIPQQLLLHAGLCDVDCLFGQAFNELKAEAGVAMDDRHLLCLLLIVERAKGTSSKWHPYISYLPQTYGASLELHVCAAVALSQRFQSCLDVHGILVMVEALYFLFVNSVLKNLL